MPGAVRFKQSALKVQDAGSQGRVGAQAGGRPTTPGEKGTATMYNYAVSQQNTIGLLPEDPKRFGSFGVSLVVNGVIAAAVLFLTIAHVAEVRVKQRQMELTYLSQPKPYIPPPVKVKMPPIPPMLKTETPKIEPPKPVIEPPKVEMKADAPAPVIPAAAPRPVVKPAAPVVGLFRDATPAPSAAPKPAAVSKAAGFGDPAGVQPNPNANRAATVATVGGFGSTASTATGGSPNHGVVQSTGFGSGQGAGSPNGSVHGVVAGTGFGAGAAQSGTPGGHGTVASTGFGAAAAGPPSGSGMAHAQPVTTSIVVTQKPEPQYTAEAREMHIQGDVTLEVRFAATGEVQVLRVVNGLGHGLDEQARTAAERIRFKPATRDGKPVDQVSIIHIAFQLA